MTDAIAWPAPPRSGVLRVPVQETPSERERRLRELPDRLDVELQTALEEAAHEMDAAGNPRTARALRLARDHALSWRDVMLRRLVDMNVVMLPREQHEALIAMVAHEMVEKALQEARHRGEQEDQAFWTTSAAKITFVSGAVGLLLMALGQLYLIFHGSAHPAGVP